MHRILRTHNIRGHCVNANMIVLFTDILRIHSIDEILYLPFNLNKSPPVTRRYRHLDGVGING